MGKKQEALPVVPQTQDMISPDHVDIRNMIHLIRGQQVMLDSDLAFLYVREFNTHGSRMNNL